MKHSFLIIAILFTLFSCGSTKKVNKNVKSSEKTEVAVADSSLLIVDSEQQESLAATINEVKIQDDNVTIHVTTYDTTKPVIEATGKPPVASEMVITNTTKAAEQKESVFTTNNENKTFQIEQSGLRSDSIFAQDSTSITTEEPVVLEKGKNTLKFVRTILFCLIIILLIYFRKPILSVLGLFKFR